MESKKFVKKFIFIILGVILIEALAVYIWDPCNYYRIIDNKLKYVASAYIAPGIIKNADYDTAIIGSSMSQNFDMDVFREKLGVNPVKVNTGGITLEQRDLFYDTIKRTGKTNNYFIEIAITKFNEDTDTLDDTPVYLFDDSLLNDYKYLFGYDTWFRAMPISFAYELLNTAGIKIKTHHNLESVDYVGDWYYKHSWDPEKVRNMYINGEIGLSEQDTNGMLERMLDNVDKKLTTIIEEENQYVFYLPPYSALFWYHTKEEGYFDIYMCVKQHIIEKLVEYPNVKVYDFQGDELICDLSNYKDLTHYKKDINDWMVEQFAEDRFRVYKDNICEMQQGMDEAVDKFIDDNKEWLIRE